MLISIWCRNVRFESVEGAKKCSIVTFHDDGGRENQRECNGLGIEADTFLNCHIVLPFSGTSSIIVLFLDSIQVSDKRQQMILAKESATVC